MPVLAELVDGVIGVDTHRDTLAAAALSSVGGVLGQTAVRADAAGYQALLSFADVHLAGRRCWAIEGAGSYGAGLAAFLRGHGEQLVEAGRPKRPPQRSSAKTDAIDAVRAARDALGQPPQQLPAVRQRGDHQARRVLLTTRRTALAARVAAVNQLKALVVAAPEDLRAELRGLSTRQQVAVCAALRDRPTKSLEHRMTVRALRCTARRIQALQAEAVELLGELERLVMAIGPWLLELFGVGPSAPLSCWSAGHMPAGSAPRPPSPPWPGSARSRPAPGGSCATASTVAVTASSTRSCIPLRWSAYAMTRKRGPTPPGAPPRARARGISSAA
jgi:transposase